MGGECEGERRRERARRRAAPPRCPFFLLRGGLTPPPCVLRVRACTCRFFSGGRQAAARTHTGWRPRGALRARALAPLSLSFSRVRACTWGEACRVTRFGRGAFRLRLFFVCVSSALVCSCVLWVGVRVFVAHASHLRGSLHTRTRTHTHDARHTQSHALGHERGERRISRRRGGACQAEGKGPPP